MRFSPVLLALCLTTPAWAQGEATPPDNTPPTTTETPPTPETPPTSPPDGPPTPETPPTPVVEEPKKPEETPPPPPATPAAPTTPAMPPRSPTGGPQLEGPRDNVPDCRATAAVCWKNDLFAIWPRLRLRAGYEQLQADSQVLTVGQNDGFFLDQVRFGVDGAFKDEVRFRFILDVTSVTPGSAPNDPVQGIQGAVRDAWVAWLPSDWLFVSAGQQFMPADLEGSSTIAGLPFARRSVATSGVRPGHGFAVAGLSPSRQMGLVLGSTENARLGPVGVEYLLGVSNGNGQNINGNDNKLPAGYARLGASFDMGDLLLVRAGVGGRYNPRTVGTLPNLFNETDEVVFGDLSAKVMGIVVAGQGIFKQTAFDTLFPTGGEEAVDTGVGATAWLTVDKPLGFDLFGVKPAYRFSYYDPSSSFADDQLLENSFGVRWDVPIEGLPATVFVDGTLLTEFGEGVRDLDNGRVTALVQLEL